MSRFTIFDLSRRGAARMIAALMLTVGGLAGAACADTVVGFEELSLDPDSRWNGSDGSGGFTSGGAHFNNRYDTSWDSWSGWSYSNVDDATTPDYGNQYAACTGTGAGGSGNYAVAYGNSDMLFWGCVLPSITIPEGMQCRSAMVTNTTYAKLSMLQGYDWAKKFGGASGDDPDWFILTITGRDGSGAAVGSVDVCLADYRFADNAQDYVVDSWKLVDLSPLWAARSLEFDFTSSDTSDIEGVDIINTPTYVALDDLTLSPAPEPSTLAMLCVGGIAGAAWLCRRRFSLELAAFRR